MAWLSSGAAGRTKSAAGKPIQRAAGRKNCAIDLLRSPCSSRSVVARAALTEQRLRPPLVVHKADRRERAQKLLAVQNKLKASVAFFSFTPRHQGHTRARRTDPRPPKQQGICSGARRWPFWGGAGRRPPCPNGALLEKNGWVARREEAAGASRWGLWSENRPSRRCAGNKGGQPPVIFRSVSGPNSHGKPSIGRAQQGRGSRWRPLRGA